jgi:hypothetical protein
MFSPRKKGMPAWIGAVMVLLSHAAGAQQAKPIGFPEAPGRETTLKLCFQCHSDAMWRDHRQDRRGWEGVMYRMVGRGALWTQDEIDAMAGYLAAVYSTPDGKPAR